MRARDPMHSMTGAFYVGMAIAAVAFIAFVTAGGLH